MRGLSGELYFEICPDASQEKQRGRRSGEAEGSRSRGVEGEAGGSRSRGVGEAASSLSLKMIAQHTHTVEQFVESYLLAQQPPCSLLDINLDDLQKYLEKRGKNANWVSFKRLIRFLANTGRIDWDDAEVMQRFLLQR